MFVAVVVAIRKGKVKVGGWARVENQSANEEGSTDPSSFEAVVVKARRGGARQGKAG